MQRVSAQLGYGVESVRKWVHERDVTDGLAGPGALRVRELEEIGALASIGIECNYQPPPGD